MTTVVVDDPMKAGETILPKSEVIESLSPENDPEVGLELPQHSQYY